MRGRARVLRVDFEVHFERAIAAAVGKTIELAGLVRIADDNDDGWRVGEKRRPSSMAHFAIPETRCAIR